MIEEIFADKQSSKYIQYATRWQYGPHTLKFKSDHIFGPSSTNDIIYSKVTQSLFDAVYNGYNTSMIFNVYFIINMILQLVIISKENVDESIKYTPSLSYTKIHLESIFDSFNPEIYGDDGIGD